MMTQIIPAKLDRLQEVRHNALRNALYHAGRRRSFEFWNKFLNFSIVLLGAGSTISVVGNIPHSAPYLGLAVAAIAAIAAWQLVYDIAGRARDHQSLHKEYVAILAEMERTLIPRDQDCSNWDADMLWPFSRGATLTSSAGCPSGKRCHRLNWLLRENRTFIYSIPS
tara:strand:+ start:778 stop:1278 length:501 start_codon:yes stop_codon:yes gene_type:complete